MTVKKFSDLIKSYTGKEIRLKEKEAIWETFKAAQGAEDV